MTPVGFQTVYPCKEYEKVEIPIERLIGRDGHLKLYPSVTNKGYFDIDYSDGRLVLRSTRFVGLIPLSDEIAIHVEPRAEIGNLMWMVARSGIPLDSLAGFIRQYREQVGAVDVPEDLYVAAFSSALGQLNNIGPLKRYVGEISDQRLRGRLLLSETVSRFRSRGTPYRSVFQQYELTLDNPENRIIKRTAERLVATRRNTNFANSKDMYRDLQVLLKRLSPVETTGVDAEYIATRVPLLVRGLPRSHQFYEPVLWLAYLIATKSGVHLEKIGQAKFESVVLDAADVFERYLRRLIEDTAMTESGCNVLNGNSRYVPLFIDRANPITKPDYYFRRGRSFVALADAKYKPSEKISAADRYELLAFCEALNVNVAAFIVPGPDEPTHHGTTHSGKRIAVVSIDLASPDLLAEEKRFVNRLKTALDL